MTIVKYIKRQDSGWKQTAGCSGETSINLSNEIFDFLSLGMVDGGDPDDGNSDWGNKEPTSWSGDGWFED